MLRSDPRLTSAMTNDADAVTLLSQLHVEIMRTADADALAIVLGQYAAIAASRAARRRHPAAPLPSAVTNPYEKASLTSLGAMESLRLQMAMDRLSKMMSTISNLLKKASEEANGITQNIK